jgi:predicted  nucleic acid-binding Zn-ribbon protein
MFDLTIMCTGCGRKVYRVVDETCAPSRVRCTCGAQYFLRVEEDDPRSPLPDVDYDGAEGDFSGSVSADTEQAMAG